MLYVSNIDCDLISVTDTKDAVTESITKSELLSLVKRGVKVAGVFGKNINVINGVNLTDFYFNYVVAEIVSEVVRSKVTEDYEFFLRLFNLTSSYYNSIKDLKVTPVIMSSKYRFIAEVMASVCTSVYCDCVTKRGAILGNYQVISEEYKTFGIHVYKCRRHDKKVYAISYTF